MCHNSCDFFSSDQIRGFTRSQLPWPLTHDCRHLFRSAFWSNSLGPLYTFKAKKQKQVPRKASFRFSEAKIISLLKKVQSD